MVLGTGVDLTLVSRMERELAREGGGFRDVVFRPEEIRDCRDRPVEFALRFAAKEAAAKALGTGICGEVTWLSLLVEQESGGRWRIVFLDGARSNALAMGVQACHLAWTTDGRVACAWVVLEGSRKDDLFCEQHLEVRG